MEGYKDKQEGAGKRESAIKKGLKVLTVLGALGGFFNESGARAASSADSLIESIDADAEGDASESLEGTAEGIIEEVMKDGKISVVEAQAIEYAWDEMKEYLPQEMTSGEYGQTIEQMIEKLSKLAVAQETVDSVKNELIVLSLKMKIEQTKLDIEGRGFSTDPFAEEDANAVEFIPENK